MSAFEKNRFLGIAFLVLGSMQLFTWFIGTVGIANFGSNVEPVLKSITETKPPYAVTPETANSINIVKEQADRAKLGFIFWSLFSLFSAVFVVVTGFGILRLDQWAKFVGLVASALLIFYGPVGVIVGIFGIWFFTGLESSEVYEVQNHSEPEIVSII